MSSEDQPAIPPRGRVGRETRPSSDPLATALVAWVAFVFIVYLGVSGPVSRATLSRWGELLRAFAAASAIAAAGTGLGMRLLDRLGPSGMRRGERAAFGALLGLTTESFLWLLLAHAGLLQPRTAVFVTAGLLLVAIGPLRAAWRERPAFRAPVPAAAFTLLIVGCSMARVVLPPTAFDALLYHLFVPQQWIAAGRAAIWQTSPAFHFPHLVETLFAPAMLLAGDIAAASIQWWYLPLALSFVWLIASRFLASSSAWLAVCLAAATPNLGMLAASAYTDVALITSTLGVAFALLHWDRTRDRRWLVVSGAACGTAMGVKYTACAIAVSAVLVIACRLRREPLRAIGTVTVFSMSALMVAAPWYVATWSATGNPIFPFVWGGRDWDALRAAHWAAAGTGLGWDVKALLTLPMAVTTRVGDATYWDADIGPFFLALLPVLTVALWTRWTDLAPERLSVLVVTSLSAGWITFWVLGAFYSDALRQGRMLLPALVLLVPCLSWSVTSVLSRPNWTARERHLLQTLLIVGFAMSAINVCSSLARRNPLPWLNGTESREQFRQRTLGSFEDAMRRIGSLPPEARLLFLWEPRAYLSPRAAQPDTVLDELDYRLRQSGTTDALQSALARDGFTHVLVCWRIVRLTYDYEARFRARGSSYDPLPPTVRSALDRMTTTEWTLLWTSADNEYALYALPAR